MNDVAGLEHELSAAMEGGVAFDALTRQLYSTDASMYAIEPIGVAFPRSADDVAAAVRLAGAYGVAVLPRGAATSLAGQTVGRALILDCSRHLRSVLEIDRDAQTARVEPGVVQQELNRAVASAGLIFGPDTSTANRATLGGMIGNNSGGTHSVIYGMTIEHVRSLEVVLSDGSTATLGAATPGEVARRAAAPTAEGRLYRELPELRREYADAIADGYPPYWRRSGGYRLDRLPSDGSLDLAKVVTGSEGTLVVVTEATVDLVPRPVTSAIAVGHFTSTGAAIAATEDALSCSPSAVELLDATILDLARTRRDLAAISGVLDGQPAALLFVTFNGDTPAEAAAGVERLTAIWQRHGHGYATLRAVTPAEQAPLLRVRASALGLLMAASEGAWRPLAFVEDTAVDPQYLAEYVERFHQALERRGVPPAGFYGHCSVGCLHIRPFLDLRLPEDVATMRAISEEVLALAAEYGGVNSSEHGDGLARTEFNRRIFGEELYRVMCRVKEIFDPDNRMNPGKIVEGPSMTEHLRDAAMPEPIALSTKRSFAEGSMFAAADRCMRIGACRKLGEGTMCPSYMATLDEQHSTRGRADALVAALAAPDPRAALGNEDLHGALDLCLECKACKSECPLSVDMASLKSEFLAQYYEVHGVPARARAIARVRTLNRIGSRVAPIANGLLRSRPLRVVLERTVGFDRRRPLPSLAGESLDRWFARHGPGRAAASDERGTVILFSDTFTNYSEPSIGRAAVELLLAAGYTVELEAGQCCGRPQISKGLLDEAKANACHLVARLGPRVAAGARVVGWEPSCVSAMIDDIPALLPDEPLARVLADNVALVEDVVLEAVDSGALQFAPDSEIAGRRILFHGHCHQKAVIGTASSVGLLRSIPGTDVVELDAGCCGMAGSFGFEVEHYDLSMAIGADRLFPAVDGEPDSTLVAATGVSCRQQIAHGTTHAAHHPIELARAALRGR